MQFHLLFMQTVDYYHGRVLPAILIIQRAILVYNWRKHSARNTVSIRVAKRLSLRVSQAVQAADRLSRTRRELQGRPRASSSVHQLREQQQHVLLPLHEVPVTEGEIRLRSDGCRPGTLSLV